MDVVSSRNETEAARIPRLKTRRHLVTIRHSADLMELEGENDGVVWCLVATVSEDAAPVESASRGARTFEAGTKVYCFPPVRGGAYESVKVIGPQRKSGKLVSAVVAAADLANWKAEPVHNTEVLEQISPPWDSSDVSKGVAEGIAAWKAGGHWPTAELRQWNRRHAEKHIGEGTLFNRLRNSVARIFGRQEE